MSSPFYPARREYEERNLYWLPHEFLELEDRRPVYITGSRGTGKTCFLRALTWDERQRNPYLQRALAKLKPHATRGRFIGVYLRLSEFITPSFDLGPDTHPEDTRVQEMVAQRFSMWLELMGLYLLLDALVQLRLEGELNYSLGQENSACERILEDYPGMRAFLTRPSEPAAFPTMRTALHRMQTRLRQCSITGTVPYPEDSFPILPIGAFLKDIGRLLMAVVSQSPGTPPQHFKLCIDEAECLSPFQQVVVNTMARVAADPVSLAVAFVRRPWNIAATLIPNVINTDADVHVVDLDEQYSDRTRFREFVTEVCKLRLQDVAQDPKLQFDPEQVMGRYSVDDLMYHLVQSTTRSELKEFAARARRLGSKGPSEPDSASEEDEEAFGSSTPRLYLQYLRDKRQIEIGAESSLASEGPLRKYQVAALVRFCRENGFDVPYGGLNVMLHLSNGCIRDFLRQMHFVYMRVNCDPKEFVATRVPIGVQSPALYDASKGKLADIRTWVYHLPDEVNNLIRGLGTLRVLLQNDSTRLDGPERGIFRLGALEKDLPEGLSGIVEEAQTAGYITVLSRSDEPVALRLHQLLAPAYQLSYRRPLHEVDLLPNEVLAMAKAGNESERDAIALKAFNRVTRNSTQQVSLNI